MSELKRAGYLVLDANDLKGALKRVQTHSRQIHLALIDKDLDIESGQLLQMYSPKMRILSTQEDGRESAALKGIVQQVRQFFAP